MKKLMMAFTLLSIGVAMAQHPSKKAEVEENVKGVYTQELKDLYEASRLLENSTPEEINANRLAIKNAWMNIDPQRGQLYKPLDNGGHTADFIASVIDYHNTPPPLGIQGNKWAQDVQIHDLRVDGGVDLVEFNDGIELYATSYRALPTPTLDIFASYTEGETWQPWRSIIFSEPIVKFQALSMVAPSGDWYLLVYYLTQGNFFIGMRWNLTTGDPVETQAITGNIVDFTVDRNYPNDTANQRVFAIYQKDDNSLYGARTNAGTYGFDWVDEGWVNAARFEPSLCYSTAGYLYLASVYLSDRGLTARVNTDYNDPNAWEPTQVLEQGSVRESLKPSIRAERSSVNTDNVIVVTSSRGAGSTGKYNIRRYIRKDGADFGAGITNASPNGISYLHMDSYIRYSGIDSQVKVAYLRQSMDGSENNRALYRPYDGDILLSSDFASFETLNVYDGYQPLAISSFRLEVGEEPMMVFAGTSADGTHGEGLYFDKESTLLSTISFDENDFFVYPNPAQDILELDFSSETPSKSISLVDATGKQVLEKNSTPTGNHFSLDISLLQSGIYFLTVKSGEGAMTKKIIKK
ncbi:MAG: T9SS type A sorting domain-containing protein [Flavobacteriaceae bacterium]